MKKFFAKETILQPIVPEGIISFLENFPTVFPVKDHANGPIHIVFPSIVSNQIKRIKESFESTEIDVSLFFAHKPTKSSALIKQAIEDGISIDVASLPELEHVMSLGCPTDRIEATGPKNQEYLLACIKHNLLISVDSFTELQQIAASKQDKTPTVLLRIADPRCADRNKQVKVSRFGIPRAQLEEAMQFAFDQGIQLKGFHFHNDERDPDVKAGYIEDLLSFVEKAVQIGHTPSIANIGGGWRDIELEDYTQWQTFLSVLEEELFSGKQESTWRSFSYGMYLNNKGRVSGRERIQGKFTSLAIEQAINRTFQQMTSHDVPLHQMINDSFLTVMTEPGYFLTQGAGISLLKVVGVADNPDGSQRVLVDGNMYNLSVQMRELLADPVLLPSTEQPETADESWKGFIMGNLCREEDLLMRRRVTFNRQPVEGDYICFFNTAGYTSFEDANPHMHSSGTTYVATKTENNWQVTKDL